MIARFMDLDESVILQNGNEKVFNDILKEFNRIYTKDKFDDVLKGNYELCWWFTKPVLSNSKNYTGKALCYSYLYTRSIFGKSRSWHPVSSYHIGLIAVFDRNVLDQRFRGERKIGRTFDSTDKKSKKLYGNFVLGGMKSLMKSTAMNQLTDGIIDLYAASISRFGEEN